MKSDPKPSSNTEQRPLYSLVRGIVTLCVLSGAIWITSSFFNTGTPQRSAPALSPASSPTKSAANTPLLFGTNMKLSNQAGQPLSGEEAIRQLKLVPARIIRLPASNLNKELLTTLKNAGVTPLVILYGPLVPQEHEQNINALRMTQEIMGENSIVYYEFGNEEDLLGVGVDRYTASWNKTIPVLKDLAPQARFLGPVTYQYDEHYLTSFLRNARPLPDEVSWHEYACDNSWSKEECLHHIDDWGEHISKARTIMQTTIKKELPVVISEWYYAPNAQANDEKGKDSGFLTTWMTKAMQTFQKNSVSAAMLCACIENMTTLVDADGQLSVQGITFRYLYALHIGDTRLPGSIPGNLQATMVSPRASRYFYNLIQVKQQNISSGQQEEYISGSKEVL